VSRQVISATGETVGEYTSRLTASPVLLWHAACPRNIARPTPGHEPGAAPA